MQLFSADATIFFEKIFSFCPQKIEKKPPSKVAQKNSNPLFFPYCLSCPNGPNRSIYVPKCGQLLVKLGSKVSDQNFLKPQFTINLYVLAKHFWFKKCKF